MPRARCQSDQWEIQMEERIQKIIAARAGLSRRKAEELVREGRVRVNGNTAQ